MTQNIDFKNSFMDSKMIFYFLQISISQIIQITCICINQKNKQTKSEMDSKPAVCFLPTLALALA